MFHLSLFLWHQTALNKWWNHALYLFTGISFSSVRQISWCIIIRLSCNVSIIAESLDCDIVSIVNYAMHMLLHHIVLWGTLWFPPLVVSAKVTEHIAFSCQLMFHQLNALKMKLQQYCLDSESTGYKQCCQKLIIIHADPSNSEDKTILVDPYWDGCLWIISPLFYLPNKSG